MKNTLKTTAVIVLSLITICALAGCSSKSTDTPEDLAAQFLDLSEQIDNASFNNDDTSAIIIKRMEVMKRVEKLSKADQEKYSDIIMSHIDSMIESMSD